MPERLARWILALLICAAAGCANGTGPANESVSAAPAEDEPRLHLELIEKMLESGRAYAALAHLDALDAGVATGAEARLLRAETLRRLGRRQQAASEYRSLLETEEAALAWRGLALIEVEDGDLGTAVSWLRKARDLQPTSPRIRNDLGYALLLHGELEDARFELATALELGGERRAARNLVLLHLLRDEPEAAARLARRHEIDARSVDRLRRRAETLRTHLDEGDGA